jgi:hypothetical protein
MPKEFDACRKGGGKVRTVQLSGGKYVHVCYLNGKQYRGEVKLKVGGGGAGKGTGGSPVAEAIAEKMKG